MTADALRDEIAAMRERLGHTVINSLAAREIVTIKGERKFITMYTNPSAPDATRSGAVWQLRDRVVAASAERGFYVSVRRFTAEAQQFADTAPIQLIDGSRGEKAPCWVMGRRATYSSADLRLRRHRHVTHMLGRKTDGACRRFRPSSHNSAARYITQGSDLK
jgi:hypothetical protein